MGFFFLDRKSSSESELTKKAITDDQTSKGLNDISKAKNGFGIEVSGPDKITVLRSGEKIDWTKLNHKEKSKICEELAKYYKDKASDIDKLVAADTNADAAFLLHKALNKNTEFRNGLKQANSLESNLEAQLNKIKADFTNRPVYRNKDAINAATLAARPDIFKQKDLVAEVDPIIAENKLNSCPKTKVAEIPVERVLGQESTVSAELRGSTVELGGLMPAEEFCNIIEARHWLGRNEIIDIKKKLESQNSWEQKKTSEKLCYNLARMQKILDDSPDTDTKLQVQGYLNAKIVLFDSSGITSSEQRGRFTTLINLPEGEQKIISYILNAATPEIHYSRFAQIYGKLRQHETAIMRMPEDTRLEQENRLESLRHRITEVTTLPFEVSERESFSN